MDYETLIETISAGTSAISYVVSLAATVLTIVALWKTYAKANEPGWAVLIPFYGDYVLFKISGKRKLFWAYLGIIIGMIVLYIGFFISLFGLIGKGLTSHYRSDEYEGLIFVFVLCLIGIVACAIALLVIQIFQCIGLAKSFGLSGGYAVGLIFIPVVFYCIIAFNNKIRYVGDGTFYGGPNGYGSNGQMPYGQPPVYMNPYTGQPQQGYQQNSYGTQPQNYGQNPYGTQPQNFGQNPYGAQPQSFEQNPYSAQNNDYIQQNQNQKQ